MNAHDGWQERISRYLDGELEAGERASLEAHLGECAPCRALLEDLRAIVAAARGLGARPPERDLWPALEHALAGPRRRREWTGWLAAFAAGVLVALGASVLVRGDRAAEADRVARAGESYLLLLHEPEGFGAGRSEAEQRAVVERYASWAAELGARCLGGEELEESGLELRPGASEPTPRASGARIGGYFLVAARDGDEALALARTCPHLEQGGWIELRRIRAR